VLRIGREECPYCHRSSEIYISHAQDVWEDLLILLLLYPVRCHDCMHRFYRPVFVPTPIAPRSEVARKSAQHAHSTDKDQHRSA
jgi:hypothetical protein